MPFFWASSHSFLKIASCLGLRTLILHRKGFATLVAPGITPPKLKSIGISFPSLSFARPISKPQSSLERTRNKDLSATWTPAQLCCENRQRENIHSSSTAVSEMVSHQRIWMCGWGCSRKGMIYKSGRIELDCQLTKKTTIRWRGLDSIVHHSGLPTNLP